MPGPVCRRRLYCCDETPLAVQAPRFSTHRPEFTARRTRMPGTDERISNPHRATAGFATARLWDIRRVSTAGGRGLRPETFPELANKKSYTPGARAQVWYRCSGVVPVDSSDRELPTSWRRPIRDRPGSLPAHWDRTASPGAASPRTMFGEHRLRKVFYAQMTDVSIPSHQSGRYAVGPDCARHLAIARVFALRVPLFPGRARAAIGRLFGPAAKPAGNGRAGIGPAYSVAGAVRVLRCEPSESSEQA